MKRRPLLGSLVAAIITITLLPVPVLIWMSFFDQSFLAVPPRNGYTFDWYVRLPQHSSLFNGLIFSLLLAAGAATVSTLVGVMAAFAAVRGRFRQPRLVEAFMTLPLTVPNIVLSMAIYVFLFRLGSTLGVSLSGNFYSLLAAHVVITIPWTFRISAAGVLALNRDFERSSLDLGAGKLRTFLKVSLPLLRPAVFASALLAFTFSFGTLEISLFLTSPHITTLPVAMMQFAEQTLDPTIAAISVVQMIITAILLLSINKVFGLGRTFQGGLKE